MDSKERETALVDRILQDFGLRRPAHRIRFGYWALNLLSAAIIWLIMAGFGAMVTTVGVTRAAGAETAAIASAGVFTLFFAASLVALRVRGRAYAEFDPETRQFMVQKGKKTFEANIDDMEFELPRNSSAIPAPVRFRTSGSKWQTNRSMYQGALWSPKGLAEFEQLLIEASASYTWV